MCCLIQGKAGGTETLVFMLNCWLLALINIIFALSELIIGFFLLLPILVNRLGFSLCLMTAPFFIFCGAWEKTKGYFSSWLNTTLTYGLSLPVLAMATGLMMVIKDDLFNKLRTVSTLGGIGELGLAIISIPLAYLMGSLIKSLGEIAGQWVSGGSLGSGGVNAAADAAGKAGGTGALKTAKAASATAGATVGTGLGVGAAATEGAYKGTKKAAKGLYNLVTRRNRMSASKD